ncbi:MAG: hypothetical protein QF681_20275, partial [Vicinamibacterales bacterium]|nr:hypothetical protein [Vicinamibacterales bacterium]
IAAFEILVVTAAISNLIREGKTFQIESMLQTGKKDGMIALEQSLQELVMNGLVEVTEAARHSGNPAHFLKTCPGASSGSPSL